MKQIYEKRSKSLKLLIDSKFDGSAADFARHYGLDETRVRQLIGGKFRNFGEKAARQMEDICELPEFYFDIADSEVGARLILTIAKLNSQSHAELLRHAEAIKRDNN